ncbi:MAG: glycosyltransferase [Methanobacteriaceae archaeon]|jgi:glycosyltransferase involved in cell wall biosynthesis|nr:glycosyltransferase [Candidatus Methanorudis spinitermitis]
MDILHIVPSFYPCLSAGGVVNASYQLSRKQVEKRNKVSVFTTDSCKPRLKLEKRYNMDVNGVKTYYFRNLSNYLKTSFLIDTPLAMPFKGRKMIENYEILHIHEHRHSLAIIMSHYALKNNIPYVLQAHGSVLPFFQKKSLKKIFDKIWGFKMLHNASKVFALTEIEKQQYLKMNVIEENIEIVPLGINLTEYDNLPSKGKFRSKFKIGNDDKLILFIGRIHRIKGLKLLVKSFKLLKNDLKGELKNNSSLKLAIVGPDDGFLEELNKLIEKLNLKEDIILTGPLFEDDKRSAIVDSDIFVMPSKYESFTTSGLEAMACEKPLVLTKNNHIHTWVNNNVGFSCDYDEKDFVNSIKKLLNDEKLIKKFGKNGRKLIEEKYNWDVIEKQIKNIYNSILE